MLRWLLVGLLLLIAVGQWGMGIWVYQNRQGREASLLVLLLLSFSVPVIGTAIQVTVNSLLGKIIVFTVWTTVIWGAVVVLVFLTIAFAGYPHWITRRTAALGLGYFAVHGSLALTNPVFEWLYADFQLTMEPFPILVYTRTPLYQLLSLSLIVGILFALTLLVSTLIQSRRWTAKQSIVLLGANIPSLVVGVAFVTNTQLKVHPLILAGGMLGLVYGWVIIREQHLPGETLARETALSHVEEGIIMLNTDGIISDYNDSAERMFPQLTGAIGSHIRTVEPAIWTAQVDEMHPDALTDYLEQTGSGNERKQVISVNCSAVTVGTSLYGYVISLHDVTTLRERERELKQRNEQLDQFASVVSHDLRNPLSVANGYLELGMETGDTEPLENVREQHQRMEAMIDDLLTLAQTGQTVEDPELVSLAAVAEDAWTNAAVPDCDIAICVSEAVTIQADRNRLLHVFENLFRNTADHNDPPLTVRIGTLETPDEHPDSSDTSRLGFFIEDNGAGIPEAEQNEIFDYGYTSRANGTGFGLSIVEDIVQAHGWTIQVTNGDSGGARFEITDVEFNSV